MTELGRVTRVRLEVDLIIDGVPTHYEVIGDSDATNVILEPHYRNGIVDIVTVKLDTDLRNARLIETPGGIIEAAVRELVAVHNAVDSFQPEPYVYHEEPPC